MRFFFSGFKGKPRVLSTHGSLLGYKKYLPGSQQIPYKIYDWVTFKYAARKADAVIVSSKFEFQDAVEFGIDRAKIHIIPMGIDVEEISSKNADDDSPLEILFVGRLARVRRVELLLQAVSRLSIPYRVTIVGGEEETASLSKTGYLNELESLCGELGIREQVTFTGAKTPGELKTYYQNADVFVYPSLYENFGQPVLEAAAAGLPIISTDVGVAREIVEDGETGFIIDGSPAEIRGRLEELNSRDSRTPFGEKIRKRVRRNYGWENVMQRYIEIYRSL